MQFFGGNSQSNDKYTSINPQKPENKKPQLNFEFVSSIKNSKMSQQNHADKPENEVPPVEKKLSKSNFEKSAPNLLKSETPGYKTIFQTLKVSTGQEENSTDFDEDTHSQQAEVSTSGKRSNSLLKPIFNQTKRKNFKMEMEKIRKADKQARRARRDTSVSSKHRQQKSRNGINSNYSQKSRSKRQSRVKSRYLQPKKIFSNDSRNRTFHNHKSHNVSMSQKSASSRQSKASPTSLRHNSAKIKIRSKRNRFAKGLEQRDYSVLSNMSRSVRHKINSEEAASVMGNFSGKVKQKALASAKYKQGRAKQKIPRFKQLYYIDDLLEQIDHLKSERGNSENQSENFIRNSQEQNEFKTSVKNKSEKGRAFYDHFLQSIQSVIYMKNNTKPDEDEILGKKVYLPPKREGISKTIIFDLDETLIHCNDDPTQPCDIKVPIKFTGGDVIQAGLTIRPYAKEILKILSQHYEIVVFTASHACYANIVLNILDPENKFISYRLFRDHCMKTKEGIFIKDLRIISNRKMKDMLIVDNAFYSYGFQMFNGVPIIPYYKGKTDQELKKLSRFLIKIKNVDDFRTATKTYFFIHLFKKYCNKQDLLETMMRKARSKI